MSGLSFKFEKTSKKKVLTDSKLRDTSTKDDNAEKDYILDVRDKAIKGSLKPKEEKGPLVIPMIKSSDWRTKVNNGDGKSSSSAPKTNEDKNINGDTKSKELSLLDEAARELIEQAAKENKDWNERSEDGKPRLDAIPTILANGGSGAQNDDDNDGPKAEVSTMEDYENVPIEQFGMAMLRGMGFKEGEGIGGFKKEVVPIFDPQVRPKGLGLGASRPKKNEKVAKEGEEKLELKKGAHVKIESGVNKGLYGEVKGLDEENGRVIVKLALSKNTTSVSENIIELVSKTEFKERGKVVNYDKYEKYKEKEEERQRQERKRDHRSSSVEKKKKSEKSSSKKTKVYEISDSSSGSDSSPEVKRVKKSRRTWVQTGLKVRCVDSRMREGKFYNVKMEVIDVVTNDSCDCRTDEGKLLQDVRLVFNHMLPFAVSLWHKRAGFSNIM